jgi:hypothetical protein
LINAVSPHRDLQDLGHLGNCCIPAVSRSVFILERLWIPVSLQHGRARIPILKRLLLSDGTESFDGKIIHHFFHIECSKRANVLGLSFIAV